ncbi:MAG: proline--tRNA ligase [Nitrospinae bacterium]|nr:proline--tRNA ligase [Nitrospinota bacterium]
MRLTRYHLPTLKEAPSEAEVVSQKLMTRAGMIRKLAAGVYTTLPLGLKVIRKIENIIREEMNRAGALEVFMPSVQPAELWIESGRWEVYGKELLRFADRHGRDFCYGPTHEEVVTDLVRRDVRSYRELPVNLYQIQTKFRDEIRPRFGVMRGREFSMKDAYSFDADDEGASKSYEAMRVAYNAIFRRLGLKFRAVEADTGQIGGSFSHEFMVLAESGEDTIAYCGACDYAANMEKAETPPPVADGAGEPLPLTYLSTPGKGKVEDVAAFLKTSPASFIKTLIYKTDSGGFVAALVRGDHEVNEVKLKRAVNAVEIALAEDAEVERITGAPVGFAGPLGISIPIVADHSVKAMVNAVTGANKADTHVSNVNPARDFPAATYIGIRNAKEGDACPRCSGGKIKMAKGIEVGHIFKLGTKYSEAMRATFLDREGCEKPMIMGCYGIGVGRSAAAAIEQNHDAAGIIWPPAIAPFGAVILPLNMDDANVVKAAEDIYAALSGNGLDPALDDRDVRSGVKFNDADLVGYPIQVIVGRKGLAEGKAEIKVRKTGEKLSIPLSEVTSAVKNAMESLLAQ